LTGVYASEADMACRGVYGLSMARRRTIAPAIVRSAEVRAAFKHLAWNLDVRPTSDPWSLQNADDDSIFFRPSP